MLQQRPVLSQVQNIKGLEPDLPVRELVPRNNSKSPNSNQNEYDFEKAMAATRQQMDRHLEAKREARLQVAERQEQAVQAQRAQETRAQQERALESRQQSTQANEREKPRAEGTPRRQQQDVPRREPAIQKDRADRVSDKTELSRSEKAQSDASELKSADKTTSTGGEDQVKDEVKLSKSDDPVQSKQVTGSEKVALESNVKGEMIEDSNAPVAKALSELEALLDSLLNGEPGASKTKTEQLLQNLAALMKGESSTKDGPNAAIDIDQQLAQLLSNLNSLTGSNDGPGIDPLTQLVNNIDLDSILEQLSSQLNNLNSLDLSQLSEQQLAVFEQLQEQLKLLTQKLNNFAEQASTDQVVETVDVDKTTLTWLNEVVLKLKSESENSEQGLTSASAKAQQSDESLDLTTTKAIGEQLTQSGSATIKPDGIVDTNNKAGALNKNAPINFANITNNQANGLAKSDGNAAMAQQVIAALNNPESSAQTKPPITTPIQLQAGANSQATNTNTIAQGAVSAELEQQASQNEKLNDFKLSELQRLMTDTGTSKSSQLKTLIESGVLGDSINTDKSTTYSKPSVVEVAGVQLDKTLQAPKLESITQTKTDAVIKENILFNKQALASNIQAQVGMMLARNMKSVDIRLDPPELGSMQIKLSMGEQANVSFVVSSQQAKDALEESLPRLKELLEQQGMQLGDSDVRKDNDNSQTDDQDGEQASMSSADNSEQGDDAANDDEQAVEVKVKSPWQVDDYA